MLSNRLLKLERIAMELKVTIRNCDLCADGHAGPHICIPALNGVPDQHGGSIYDPSGHCRKCGKEATQVVQFVFPGLPNPNPSPALEGI